MNILRIDRIMKVQDISTQELASRMQVTPQYVSEVANGHKNITLSGLSKFANALHVPVAALLDGYHDNQQIGTTSFHCPYCGNIITIDKAK